jgi:hypothetical protein
VVPKLSHYIVGAFDTGNVSSLRRDEIHVSTATVIARLLYSAYVDDLDTVGCFIDDQDTRLELRYITKPVVDLLSSGHPA